MRERLLTLACACGALLLFLTLFWRGEGLSEAEQSLPTSIDDGDSGLRAGHDWLRAEQVPVVSLREPFTTLGAQRELAPSGNLLITTLPGRGGLTNPELLALDHWVRAGNTLLVLAPLYDRPAFAGVPALLIDRELARLTGLDASQNATRASGVHKAPASGSANPGRADKVLEGLTETLAEPKRHTLVPVGASRYFAGRNPVAAYSDLKPWSGQVDATREGLALALARDGDSGADAFWVVPDGAGSILVSGMASILSNRALQTEANAQLLANIVAATVGARGSVVFDDEHQGLTAAYDPEKFYKDPRLYRTLGVIALVWLLWVLGGTRLRLPRHRDNVPEEAELVRTTGRFLARVLRPASAARRMVENFFQRLRPRAVGAAPAEMWAWLEQHPQLAARDVAQLHDWYRAAEAEKRVPLIRLHNLLLRIERQLAA